MRILFFCLLAAFLFSAAGPAQTTLIHPAQYKVREGGGSQCYPFYHHATNGSFRQHVYQQIHDAVTTTTTPVKAMAFRREARYNQYEWGAWSATLELLLSTAPGSIGSANMSRTFSANLSGDATTVIQKKTIHFSLCPIREDFPSLFLFKFIFDSGRVFPIQAGKNLTWQMKVYDNDLHQTLYTNPYFDAAGFIYANSGPVLNFGRGGFAPRQYRAMMGYYGAYRDTRANPPSIGLNSGIAYGPRGGFGIGFWSANRFPQGLPLGAGGGKFWLIPGYGLIGSVLVKLDYRGSYNGGEISSTKQGSLLAVPDDPVYYGIQLYAQFVALDSTASSLYLPGAAKIQLPLGHACASAVPVSYTYYRGSTTGATGNGPYFNRGLIVEFTQ